MCRRQRTRNCSWIPCCRRARSPYSRRRVLARRRARLPCIPRRDVLAAPRVCRARLRLLTAALTLGALTTIDFLYSLGAAWSLVIIPSLVLLGGYRMSGLLFVRVDARAEAWLRQSDDRWLRRTGILPGFERAPMVVREFFELSYLLVYAALPVGAIVLLASGQAAGAAPLLDRRPAGGVCLLCRAAVGADAAADAAGNAAAGISDRWADSTLQPGHRLARQHPRQHNSERSRGGRTSHARLAISDALPAAGAAFAVLAVSIASASVLGRYHYAADAVLGLAVAIIAWLIA